MRKAAQTAQAIRKELKAKFPQIKFSVRSRIFAGGDSVDIEWINGPSRYQVEEIVNKYEYGHFDGMQDLYEYSNVREDIPQVKYVQTSREISDEIMNQGFKDCKKFRGKENLTSLDDNFSDNGFFESVAEFLWRRLNKVDLTNGYKSEFLFDIILTKEVA